MSERDKHKATYYSGKKPYLTHNYRTMMKKKTQEEYYFHELHEDPMSELLKPYWRDPDIPGFGWEYMGPGWWEWPPFSYPGGGGFGAGGDTGPYDDDEGLPPGEGCTECKIVGPASVECGDAWIGQIIPSQCAGFIAFGLGLEEGESFETVATHTGAIVVAVPASASSATMLICSSGGETGVTCCLEVAIECCCTQFALTGAGTVNPGNSWVGTISPACPSAECSVVSNSGCSLSCSLNEAGSQVTVGTGGGDCGGFTVTVTDPRDGCSITDSKFVTINGGSWVFDISASDLGMVGCVGCGSGGGIQNFGTSCYIGEYWYGGFDPIDTDCSGTFGSQCKGPADCGGSDGVNICGWSRGACGGAWPCATWGWVRCKYECVC